MDDDLEGCPTNRIRREGAGRPAVKKKSRAIAKRCSHHRRPVVARVGLLVAGQRETLVRLTGKAISGGNIKAEIDGPARIESENIVTERVEGRTPIGMLKKEFEIKPTGKGTVKVTLTTTSPIPNTKPKKTTYEFKVK